MYPYECSFLPLEKVLVLHHGRIQKTIIFLLNALQVLLKELNKTTSIFTKSFAQNDPFCAKYKTQLYVQATTPHTHAIATNFRSFLHRMNLNCPEIHFIRHKWKHMFPRLVPVLNNWIHYHQSWKHISKKIVWWFKH